MVGLVMFLRSSSCINTSWCSEREREIEKERETERERERERDKERQKETERERQKNRSEKYLSHQTTNLLNIFQANIASTNRSGRLMVFSKRNPTVRHLATKISQRQSISL